MIKQQAFIEKNKMLKGALHNHTTRSDGAMTPEEVIRLFKENGYDFMALTDHRVYNFKDYAPEAGMTIIPGMEFDNGGSMKCEKGGFRCFHTVCLGPAKEEGNDFVQDEKLDSAVAKNQEEYQPYLDKIHAKKNLTMYCHPEWSSTSARYFDKMQGNFAMEIWNSGCAIEHDMDTDAAYWDELLGQGIKIFGAATDDGHKCHQHCKGWVMVNSENNVNAILKALEEGKFYSSCGPEIYDFYVEDGSAVIECSPVATVRMHCDGFPTIVKRSENADFTRVKLRLGDYPYVRMSIIDKDGKYAWTNPIFLK